MGAPQDNPTQLALAFCLRNLLGSLATDVVLWIAVRSVADALQELDSDFDRATFVTLVCGQRDGTNDA